jgi:hypothetical protein
MSQLINNIQRIQKLAEQANAILKNLEDPLVSFIE